MLANNLPVFDKNALSVRSFLVIDRIFLNDRKKLSQLFGHNVLKSRLVNTVTTTFNSITLHMAEMF